MRNEKLKKPVIRRTQYQDVILGQQDHAPCIQTQGICLTHPNMANFNKLSTRVFTNNYHEAEN